MTIEELRLAADILIPIMLLVLGYLHSSNVSRFTRIDKSIEHLHACIESIKVDQLAQARNEGIKIGQLVTRSDLETTLSRIRLAIQADIQDNRDRISNLEKTVMEMLARRS